MPYGRIILGVFAAMLASCNENVLGCPDGECATACQGDEGCPQTQHCAAGQCVTECGPMGPACGEGQTCGQRGRCVPLFGDGGNGTCADVDLRLMPEVPLVMLLIDQSGSMSDPFGQVNGSSVNRWQAVRYALTDSKQGAVTRLAARVPFGAALYYSKGGSRNGATCPILNRSMQMGRPALNNRDSIDKLLADNKPESDTPTAESVEAVAREFSAAAAEIDPKMPRVLILATDGNPDTCKDPDAHNQASQQLSEAAVQAAFKAGVRTYVLSVGPEVSQDHLAKLANAGVGKPLTPKSAPFYQGNNPKELVDAFDAIIRGARSCAITLNGEVDAARAGEGTVRLNDTPLQFGKDWQLKDASTIELTGGACDTFLHTDNVSLSAKFPCGVVIVK